MTRRDISLTIALCLSLTVHALLLGGAAELYTRQVGSHIYLPGFPRQAVAAGLIVVEEPEDPMRRLGNSQGIGQALDSSPGDQPMLAPQASQTQAFLSLDPEGPGRIGDEPTDSLLPLGSGRAPGTTPPSNVIAGTIDVPTPFGITASGLEFVPPPSAMVQATAIPSGQTGNSLMPGAPVAADPAPLDDSESDPVSVHGSAEFRRGSTDVRLGRKHRITRPRIALAGQADLITLPSPTVVLKLRIDETGKVVSAEVFRSSGSNEVDQPCKLAAYNWWFEPAKDKNGKPAKDVILFAIRFI